MLAHRLVEASDDPEVLGQGGWWAVAITFEGAVRLWRFARLEPAPLPRPRRPWSPLSTPWTSSLDRVAYLAGVEEIRRRIHEGEVYQVNLCRLVSTEVAPEADPWALATVLAAGNPAPYAGVIDVPALGPNPATRIVSASPELFLRREGDLVASSPIKGTGVTPPICCPRTPPRT